MRSYYLLDAQGSVRAMSSAGATLSDQYAYTAFGETRSQTGNSPQPYGYTGQQRASSVPTWTRSLAMPRRLGRAPGHR